MPPEKKAVRSYVSRGILIKNRHVLLVNKIGEPHYFLPGGRLEIGESIEQCLIREIKEELDKPCHIQGYAGAIEHFFEDDVKTQYEIGHFFIIDIPGLDPSQKPKSAEAELKFAWFRLSELKKLDLRPIPVIDLLNTISAGEKIRTFWASTINKV